MQHGEVCVDIRRWSLTELRGDHDDHARAVAEATACAGLEAQLSDTLWMLWRAGVHMDPSIFNELLERTAGAPLQVAGQEAVEADRDILHPLPQGARVHHELDLLERLGQVAVLSEESHG